MQALVFCGTPFRLLQTSGSRFAAELGESPCETLDFVV